MRRKIPGKGKHRGKSMRGQREGTDIKERVLRRNKPC
jgi:hypothetical protein